MTGIEVCTGSIGDSLIAFEAGASRLELNSALEAGGLSPSAGVLDEVTDSVSIPVLVMVRPRSGGFVYTPVEKRAMLRDMELYLDLGASGVVFGALLHSGEIDGDFVSLVRESFPGSELVFSRAFDLTPHLFRAADVLCAHGINRVLTSGGESTAFRGMDAIRELNSQFGRDLEILPGSGINSSNALEIVRKTGCGWIHGSFSNSTVVSEGSGEIIPDAAPGPAPDEIAGVRKILDGIY